MSRLLIYIAFFVISFAPTSHGQHHEVRYYIGYTYYQGDLAPTTSPFSFSPGHLSWSITVGTKLNNYFKVNAKFLTGQFGGDDMDSPVEDRRKRNLSFKSPLYEFGFNTELNINQILKGLDKYGLRVYYSMGVNVFHFNPKAIYQQQLIDLQPLGTEGQGLPGYDDHYSLTQINIPFGMGFKFQLYENIDLGVEIMPRWTFTDYLDDVSTSYVNYDELVDAGRPQTAIISNRMGEYLGTDMVKVPTGTMRGNPEDNDWYFFAGFGITYNFGSGFTPMRVKRKKQDKNLPNLNPLNYNSDLNNL